MKLTVISLAAASMLLIANASFASGGGGFGENSVHTVDQQYELGKSVYKSRLPDGSKLAYCVKTEKGLKKISRRAVKPFKKGPASAFVNSLYNCQQPNVKIADLITGDQGSAVLYYLNKRYKLRLKTDT